jgi:putative transposase
MSNYRRNRARGGTYFFTVNLADRSGDALTAHVDDLRAAFAIARRRRPFAINAVVVLPDHLHTVWTLPEGDCDFSTRWKEIKTLFTRRTGLRPARSRSKARKGECGLWQRRFWEHTIRDEADYRAHVLYCWGNPVRHGYVTRAVDWPWSSIHRDMRLGRVPHEWGAPVDGNFGE